MECPTKLFYTKKREIYADTKNENDFLKALAEGGFQVGALAKVMYPDGKEITDSQFQEQIEHTSRLLKEEDVTIYEAAICYGNLFARVDVLRKVGSKVEIVEVKAKSFDSTDENTFRGKRGGINSEMLPYLQDIAFQTYLFKLAFPEQFIVESFLMLVDKSKTSSIDGLNQLFKIRRVNDHPEVDISPDANKDGAIGTPILSAVNVDEFVNSIITSHLEAPGIDLPFNKAVELFADKYAADQKIEPSIGGQCAKCEFHNDTQPQLSSGLHECWQKRLSPEEFANGTVLDIWNYRGKSNLIKEGILKFDQVEREHLQPRAEAQATPKKGLSNFDRQWMQVSKEIPDGESFYIDRQLVQNEMNQWEYPLNFIDFETSRVAIPFFKGQSPYANIAFQFSHHVMNSDGSVEHKNQFICASPGKRPNYDFVRALKSAVGDEGTVFMWWPHENTTLNQILDELEADLNPPSDIEELKTFILSLTYKTNVRKGGDRAMVDLCDMSKRTFFHPMTNGSNSIKKVLPAVLNSSQFIKEKYSKPIYGGVNGIRSLNFPDFVWWREVDGKVVNPYDLLPPVFTDINPDDLAKLESEDEFEINQGGAASTAYARLQFETMSEKERECIQNALLKYCELDTLAMVMIVEAWKNY
jgi:hypothetical protein